MADTEEELNIWNCAVSIRMFCPVFCILRRYTQIRLTSPSLHAQAHNKIPDDAWEYQIRKNLNDAAYNGLQYVPYCSTMPVQKVCDDARFIWKKKGPK